MAKFRDKKISEQIQSWYNEAWETLDVEQQLERQLLSRMEDHFAFYRSLVLLVYCIFYMFNVFSIDIDAPSVHAWPS